MSVDGMVVNSVAKWEVKVDGLKAEHLDTLLVSRMAALMEKHSESKLVFVKVDYLGYMKVEKWESK
jgi:hypothetical protein